jgi:regulator of sigma E protease
MPFLDGALNWITLAIILVVLVVIHEAGHFIVARRAGVRVHEFGIGFPPRARILARDSETIYTLNWLPIGGFVRLEGEEGESGDPRAFVNQPLRTRLAILVAGVFMNFVLAWLIFAAIVGFADPVTHVKLGCVSPGSPAAAAGLIGGQQVGTDPGSGTPICDASGDTILAIDGTTFAVFDDMQTGDAPVRYLRSHAGRTVVLTIRHPDGTTENKTVTLRVPTGNEGALGIAPAAFDRTETVSHPILDSLGTGLRRTLDASTLILSGLRDLVTNITHPSVSGPVGIVSAVGVVRTELPPVFLFWLVGMLSANLAIVNVLPIPPMDGGRIAVAIIQRLSGNRIGVAFERAVYLVGFLALMGLLVWITYFDIQRSAGG